MEQQLIEKIKNHTTDDVDKAMIVARLKVTHEALKVHLNELSEALENLRDFCAEKKFELGMMDFSLIMAFDDMFIHDSSLMHTNGVPCLCTFGSKEEIEALFKAIEHAIDK